MWESLVFIPLLVVTFVPETFQACTRPSTGDNVVLSAELDSYYDYYYLEISCDDGYTQSGASYSYCYPSTGWDPDPSLVECQASCSLPKVDSDVIVEPEETTYSIGEKVTFSCTSGTLTGSFEGTCGTNATWIIETNPSCLDGCLAPESSNGTGTYEHTSTTTFACDTGYQLSTGDFTIEAICDDGSWSPDVECTSSGCLPPTVPTNVMYAPEESTYDENSMIVLSCEGETTPFGPEYSYCNSSKEWEPSPLLLNCYDKCEVPSFSDSDVIVTSDFTGSSDESYYDHTDTVRFSCAGGLFVDGPWKASCRNGAWSTNFGGDSPTCRANCTAPSNTLIDGQMFKHGHGEVIECVDEPGMVRLGGPKAFCIDGSWKPNVLCKYKTEL
ncbi:complement factor H [Strongylocentrotus purpuratus]|uniref:Sushi domain-containing protein n=1 Tax=Strongylocentrotus purpuratus TaxID=7668 RepID=A0A7M7RCU3_STRPU|nr:complement factor H [Strongylocentrotus purpuratus]